jgi:hypothetical protein
VVVAAVLWEKGERAESTTGERAEEREAIGEGKVASSSLFVRCYHQLLLFARSVG